MIRFVLDVLTPRRKAWICWIIGQLRPGHAHNWLTASEPPHVPRLLEGTQVTEHTEDGWHTLAINTGKTPYDTVVTLDGEPLNGVVAIAFNIDAREPTLTTVTITMECNIDARVDVTKQTVDA